MCMWANKGWLAFIFSLLLPSMYIKVESDDVYLYVSSLPRFQMDARVFCSCVSTYLSDFRCVCAEAEGCPWIALKTPTEGWWKGSPQVLLATQHNGGIAAGRSSWKVVPGGRWVKGRGWEPVGGGVGRFWSQQCAATAFRW